MKRLVEALGDILSALSKISWSWSRSGAQKTFCGPSDKLAGMLALVMFFTVVHSNDDDVV